MRHNKAQQPAEGKPDSLANLTLLNVNKAQHTAALYNYCVTYNYNNHSHTATFPAKCPQGLTNFPIRGLLWPFSLVFTWERPAAPHRPLHKHEESGPSRWRHRYSFLSHQTCRGLAMPAAAWQPLPLINAAQFQLEVTFPSVPTTDLSEFGTRANAPSLRWVKATHVSIPLGNRGFRPSPCISRQ